MRAIDKLESILASSENFLEKMHELGAEPHQRKALQRVFSPAEAGAMVGRDRTTLARAEGDIGIASAPRRPGRCTSIARAWTVMARSSRRPPA